MGVNPDLQQQRPPKGPACQTVDRQKLVQPLRQTLRDKLGICQWFHYQAFGDVTRAIRHMRELGVRHLRTGISWADYHRPEGRAWYDWQMEALSEFEVLLSIWHTPPSIAEGSTCASPPRRLEDYADFIAEVIDRYGDRFDALELWNEPNNRLKWDFPNFDPQWEKFGRMIAGAARTAKERDRTTVLGGMIPVDHHWLELMKGHGALEDIDVVAIHAFPEMWWNDAPNWDWYDRWKGWDEKIRYISEWAESRPIWVTETGLATCEVKTGRPERRALQVRQLLQAAEAPTERVYWYCLTDLHPAREAIEGFHVDENEYHLGITTHAGHCKESWEVMKELLREGLGLPASGGFERPLSVRFGSAGALVSRIGQGTWEIEEAGPGSARDALRRGVDMGLTHLDTAAFYGQGRVERLVGEALADRRDELFLVSKVIPEEATRQGTIAACEASLRRLRTDRLDCYLLHWLGPHPLEETIEAFEILVQQGKIRSWGVSNFDEHKLAEVIRIAGEGKVASNQVLYHLGQRSIEHAVIPFCREHDIAVVGYSPFGSGAFPSPDSPGGRALAEIAEEQGATSRQVALSFLLRDPSVFVIPKASRVHHVIENARAARIELTSNQVRRIEAAFPRGPRRAGVPLHST